VALADARRDVNGLIPVAEFSEHDRALRLKRALTSAVAALACEHKALVQDALCIVIATLEHQAVGDVEPGDGDPLWDLLFDCECQGSLLQGERLHHASGLA
jgi:small ligand-binding sensory domain FIST